MSKKQTLTYTADTMPTVTDYLAADRSGRATMRAALAATVSAALHGDDLALATMANNRATECREAADSATATRVTVDYGQATADRIATYRAAADMLESGEVRIDGAPDDYEWPDRFPTGHADESAASAMATKRLPRTGPVNNVGEAIRAAFAGEPKGTVLTVAEIGRRWAAAGGPSASETSGRIAARLFATTGCTVEGVVPVPATADAPRGARNATTWE